MLKVARLLEPLVFLCGLVTQIANVILNLNFSTPIAPSLVEHSHNKTLKAGCSAFQCSYNTEKKTSADPSCRF